jgi:carboxyl-terminal processing protease
VIPGGPSEKAGLLFGDLIVKVDTSVIAGTNLTNQKVMGLLKGPSGSSVKVGVKRTGEKDLVEISIERGQIPISSFDAIYKLNDSTIYVRLAQFSLTTYDEFQDRVYPLKTDQVTSFIMDLRGNGGGYLDAAVALADEFLSDGQLITYTEGKNRPKREYFASDEGKFEDVALSVIIDGYSASASEIFAGAMQDLNRASIVGRRSFGKGLVQEQNEWDDGSATRLTVARYYTPNGRSIQKPYESFSDHLTGPNDTIEGGINPDWWVENDTTGITWFYAELVHSGLLNEFSYTYRDAHFKELHSLGQDAYINRMATDTLKGALREFLENKNVPFLEHEWNRSIDKIALRSKALIGRSLFSDEVYFKLINQTDPFILKAQKEMKKPKPKTSV